MPGMAVVGVRPAREAGRHHGGRFAWQRVRVCDAGHRKGARVAVVASTGECRIVASRRSFQCMAPLKAPLPRLTGAERQDRFRRSRSGRGDACRSEKLKEKATLVSNISAVVVEGFYEDPESRV